MKKLIISFIVLLAIAVGAKAQLVAHIGADANAHVLIAITITNSTDLDFGNINALAGGTITIAPAGPTYSVPSLEPPVTGTRALATFAVTGEGSNTYDIVITPPTDDKILHSSDYMLLSDFKAYNASDTDITSTGGTLATGSQTIRVGATLTVEAAQVPGDYTGAFDVAVHYN